MAYKFIKAGFKEPFIKVVIDGEEKWASCDGAVRTYAQNNFAEGDDIEFEYEKDKDGKYSITGQVTKVGGSTQPPASNTSTSGPAVNNYTDKTESIIRQTVAKATGPVMISLQGHINPNNVNEVYNSIYDNILKKVQGL